MGRRSGKKGGNPKKKRKLLATANAGLHIIQQTPNTYAYPSTANSKTGGQQIGQAQYVQINEQFAHFNNTPNGRSQNNSNFEGDRTRGSRILSAYGGAEGANPSTQNVQNAAKVVMKKGETLPANMVHKRNTVGEKRKEGLVKGDQGLNRSNS